MLQRTPDLSPDTLRLLAALSTLAKNNRQFSYANIGRPMPGIAKAAPRGYRYMPTGESLPLVLRKGPKGNGKEPTVYRCQYLFLVDMRPTKPRNTAREQARRLRQRSWLEQTIHTILVELEEGQANA